ncbi:jasmonate O-methyltransferase [Canna indica]|uniref:Jasmonate O-methyltransferase n=1 Tax=Canna indica TaxID=4628 RepID=A0AAQ3JZF8_9LILI|nr:jasmonate O-methyltransferase [Canna indica]
MDLPKVLRMKSGVDESSYFNNSKIQGVIIQETKIIRQDAAVEAYLCAASPDTMTIADLGCSSGPTALLVVSELIEAIEDKCIQLQRQPPEFNLLLNDLYSNDFNTVFRSLPDFYWKKSGNNGQFFISGVPGSFYGRLFPSKSLHFVHSSSSLHWLSEVPEELQYGPAPYLNKGKVYISKSSPSCVLDAYLKQFQRDFRLFLKCRGEEIVSGGHMVLTLMGRKSSDPTVLEDCYYWELLADALNAMESEGLVEEEKIDSFNAPYYSPSLEELKQLIEGEGSFSIRSSERFEAGWDAVDDDDHETICANERLRYAQGMAKGVRAVLESMVKSYFGEGILDDLFSRYSKLLENYYSVNNAVVTNVVIALVRK